MYKRLYTIKEVAKMMCISRSTVERRIKKGEIKATKINGVYFCTQF
jgi:excisionase family DNA binding protein